MTAEERLFQILPKVERAKQHISNLQGEISRFFSTNPYKIGAKHDPQSGKVTYYALEVAQTDVSIPLIAGDAIQNLMSALDHLAFQLVCVSTNDRPPNPNWIYFPIADDAAKYEAKKAGKIQGARQEILDAIDLIKPYKGGNDLLWALYRLNNIEKHRLLITVGSQLHSVNIGSFVRKGLNEAFTDFEARGGIAPIIDLFIKPADAIVPLKAGDELFTDCVTGEVDEKIQFRFDVALREPQILEAQSLVETIHQMANLVEGIITTLTPMLR